MTDLKNRELELERGRRLLRAVSDAGPAMINVKDRDSRYLLMNRFQAALYGTTTDTAIGRTAGEIMGADYGDQARAFDRRVLASGEQVAMMEHDFVDGTPYVYLYNTESTTGADTNAPANVPLLGNRLDRFLWNGATLTFDRNIIKLRAFQNDRNNVADPTLPVLRGNHNGGVLRFGPDGKLYVIIGDNGRRGWMQNVLEGLITNTSGQIADDEFGGPEPDDAHLTGVILRLNDDGSTPRDDPFYVSGQRIGRRIGGTLGAAVGANLQRVFGYGASL